MNTDLQFLTIAEAGRLIAPRKLSPVELAEAFLRRIEALDSQINAYITVTAELALKQARQAEAEIMAGRYRGPLHGIPFALKDIYNTAGILTSGHSKICIDNIPAEDATTAAKLFEAGAVLLGKVATSEFAHGGPSFDLPWPPARNPWNPAHFTGSSSSGSGAAVAAGFAPCALGSDTGGSIRIPAALCGTVGLKPTYGLVSRYGVIPNSFTFDHCGPLTWTVEDVAILLQAIAGYDERDPASVERSLPDFRSALDRDIRGLRIGVIRHFWEQDLNTNEEVCRAMDAALDVLAGLGARVEEVRLRPLQEYFDVKILIAESEIFSIHQPNLCQRAGDFGMHFLGQTLAGCLFQACDYVQAQRERCRMLAEMKPIYDKYDVLVTASAGPAIRIDAYRILSAWQRPNIHTPFNVTGGPALALCNGFTASGLPLSMQIAGRPFDEATVLRVGHAYERATSWRARRPALVKGAPRVPVTPAPYLSGALALDQPTRDFVEQAAQRAGVTLNELQFELLCESAPYALAMSDRMRRPRDRAEEPANVFRFSRV